MDQWTGFIDAVNIIDKLVIVPLAYGAFILRDIRGELQKLNGRMIKMEEWQDMHDRQDDERFHGLSSRIDRLSGKW